MQTASIRNVRRCGLVSWLLETVAHMLVKLGLIDQLLLEKSDHVHSWYIPMSENV